MVVAIDVWGTASGGPYHWGGGLRDRGPGSYIYIYLYYIQHYTRETHDSADPESGDSRFSDKLNETIPVHIYIYT